MVEYINLYFITFKHFVSKFTLLSKKRKIMNIMIRLAFINFKFCSIARIGRQLVIASKLKVSKSSRAAVLVLVDFKSL